MVIATVPFHDPSQPQRGGMDCPTKPRATPTGLRNFFLYIDGYKHVTPMGFSPRLANGSETIHGREREAFVQPGIGLQHGLPGF